MDTRTPLFKFDMWSSWLQRDIDKDRTVMDTINALIVVAAFIAGIQGQIIQFTMSLPLNQLGRVANLFAFCGLMLDIIGTFSGVIHALFLQQRINESTAVLNYVTQTKVGIQATQRGANERSGGNSEEQLLGFGIEGKNALPQHVAWLAKEMRRRFLNRRPGSDVGPLLARMISTPVSPTPIPMEELDGSKQASHAPLPSFMLAQLASSFELGRTPLISMCLGVIALVISIILFAAETRALAGEVWVTCAVIPFTVMIISLVPISYAVIKRNLRRMTTDTESVFEGDD